VLAALDDKCARAEAQDLLRRLSKIIFAGEHASFTVVDQKEIPILDGFDQFIAGLRNPEIHGVAAHETCPVHLLLNSSLKCRLYVSKEKIGLRCVGGRKLGVEFSEDIEIGLQRLAIVHICRVHARPEERLAGYLLQPLQVDLLAR
jgi:hypothetical protein